MEDMCWHAGVVVVVLVRRGVSRGARGECNHLDEARIHPIPTVYFRVEKEDSHSNFFRVQSMPMMKFDRLFLRRG